MSTKEVRAGSKMAKAIELYKEITAPGYTLSQKSVRLEFLALAPARCGLSVKGASTYHHNAARHCAGGELYDKQVQKTRNDNRFGSLGSMPDLTIRPIIRD